MRIVTNNSDQVRLRYSLRWHVVPCRVRCWLMDSEPEESIEAIAHAVRLRDCAYNGDILAVRNPAGGQSTPVFDVEEVESAPDAIDFAESFWLLAFPEPDGAGNRWIGDSSVCFTAAAAAEARDRRDIKAKLARKEATNGQQKTPDQD